MHSEEIKKFLEEQKNVWKIYEDELNKEDIFDLDDYQKEISSFSNKKKDEQLLKHAILYNREQVLRFLNEKELEETKNNLNKSFELLARSVNLNNTYFRLSLFLLFVSFGSITTLALYILDISKIISYLMLLLA